MAYDMDVKKKLDALIPKTTVQGGLRPDVKQDDARRQTGSDLIRGQVSQGEVPQPGQKATAQQSHLAGLPSTPAQPTMPRPATPDKAPVTGHPEAAAGHEISHATSPQTRSPNSPEMEQAVQAGKQAFNALQNLAGGGVKKGIQNLPNLPAAVMTSKEVFQKALAARSPGTKSNAQPKLTDTAAKTATPHERTPQESVTEKTVLAKAKAEEQSGANATQIAQLAPSPFATQPRSEVNRVNEQNKDIESDQAAEGGLKLLAHGEGAKGVARAKYSNQEFSKGSYNIAFIEEDDLAAIEGNVGPVPGRAVAIDGSSAREVAVLLHFTNTILKTAEDRPPAEVLIKMNADDTPLSLRVMGSAKDHKQMAEGGRGSPYGLGKIFG